MRVKRDMLRSIGIAAAVGILLVSCSSGGGGAGSTASTTAPAPVATAATPMSTPADPDITSTTVPVDQRPIRAVDLANSTLPAGSCADQNWKNPEPIPLVAGKGESGDKNADPRPDGSYLHAEATLATNVDYVDLDGDGRDEGVVAVGCSAGGNAHELHVLVLTNTANGLVLVGGGPVHPVYALSAGKRQSTIGDWRREGNEIVAVEKFDRSGSESNCCLTGTVEVRWQISNGSWATSIGEPAGSGSPVDVVTSAPKVSVGGYRTGFSSQPAFRTPSGNIECEWMAGSGVVCYVKERTSPPPPPPGGCGEITWVWNYVRLDRGEVSNGVCTGGILHNSGTGNVLSYGSALIEGDFGCLSEERGVTCVRVSTGKGFFLSRQEFRSF